MGQRRNPWELRFDQHGWGGPPRGPGGPPPWVQGLLGHQRVADLHGGSSRAAKRTPSMMPSGTAREYSPEGG